MTDKINTFFTEKNALAERYFEERHELQKRKDAIDWRNREARQAISEQLYQMTCPLNSGELEAVRAWNPEADTFIATDHLWTKDIHDFVACLREAGVKTFLFTDTSTALMESIHEFAKEGVRLEGPETFTTNDGWNNEERIHLALRFTL
ncbi:MAG: hypothetical protein IJ766_04975 [Clostridia bacterium]|nr:hypothetical protein [Clostridia bacterium]